MHMAQQLLLLVAFPYEVLQLRVFGPNTLQHSALLLLICNAIGQSRRAVTLITARFLANGEPRFEAINAARERTRVLYEDLAQRVMGQVQEVILELSSYRIWTHF